MTPFYMNKRICLRYDKRDYGVGVETYAVFFFSARCGPNFATGLSDARDRWHMAGSICSEPCRHTQYVSLHAQIFRGML